MDTLESLRRKIGSAGELESVVKTMKAMAAANISQYEMAAVSLTGYYHAVELGIMAYFTGKSKKVFSREDLHKNEKSIGVIIFGSDQGLVGQFNEVLSVFVSQALHSLHGKTETWAVGERIGTHLMDSPYKTSKLFPVPNSLSAITSLVGELLEEVENKREKGLFDEVYIFYNRPTSHVGYEPACQRLLPLDESWKQRNEKKKWPTHQLPQVVGKENDTLAALIKEYLFVSVYRACAASLASENASRLEAMQRAEKNIDELLDDLNNTYHRLRQSSIDEELFDVVAGFEALKKK